jgi:hypothetical protein
MSRIAALLALLACTGCKPEETGGPDDSGADTGTDTDTDTGGPVTCEREGFAGTGADAVYFDAWDAVLYGAVTSDGAPYDGLNLELYYGGGATVGPHDFVFTGESIQDCTTCLTAATACTDPDTCEKQFAAWSGTMHVTAAGRAGDQLAGNFEDVVLREAVIDPASLETTWVEGGEEWCLDGWSFDVTIQD